MHDTIVKMSHIYVEKEKIRDLPTVHEKLNEPNIMVPTERAACIKRLCAHV